MHWGLIRLAALVCKTSHLNGVEGSNPSQCTEENKMTLILSKSPESPEIKTWFDDVYITLLNTQVHITMEDFMAAAYYVLTNSPLTENDPRLKFIDIVKKMKILENKLGFKYGGVPCRSLHYPENKK